MASRKSWLLVLAVLLLTGTFAAANEDVEDVSDDEYADAVRAHLVVAKALVKRGDDDLAYPLIVQGRNATVVITVHNLGAGTATDVVLKDVLPSNAQLVSGELEAKFPKIASGSSVSISYVIVFTSGGSSDATYLPAATVTYKAEENADKLQKGASTSPGLFLLTPVQQITRYALIVGAYASLGICRTATEWRNMGLFLGVVGGLLGVNWALKQARTTTTSTQRKKALKELEKEQ